MNQEQYIEREAQLHKQYFPFNIHNALFERMNWKLNWMMALLVVNMTLPVILHLLHLS